MSIEKIKQEVNHSPSLPHHYIYSSVSLLVDSDELTEHDWLLLFSAGSQESFAKNELLLHYQDNQSFFHMIINGSANLIYGVFFIYFFIFYFIFYFYFFIFCFFIFCFLFFLFFVFRFIRIMTKTIFLYL